MYILSFD
ncbi:hypothetical protein OXX79_014382, partial [Metschnikowia pulcherrima]